MDLFHLKLLIFIIGATNSFYSEIKDNVLSFLRRSRGDVDGLEKQIALKNNPMRDNTIGFQSPQYQSGNIQEAAFTIRPSKQSANDKVRSVIDWLKNPNSNNMQRTGKNKVKPNLKKRRLAATNSSSSSESSSSLDQPYWQEEFQEQWIQKKFEALNSSGPEPNILHMTAARPWGVPCGDQVQHDMPWGTCMLPQECDPEYRIYRGDYFCGRTQFVCCAVSVTNYDLYQGIDISFQDSNYATDTEEKRESEKKKGKDSKKRKRKNAKKRKRARDRRKRKIRRNIRKIVREIRRLLNKASTNGTRQRKQKTKWLKKYIKDLKKQYKRDRKAVRKIHSAEIKTIDETLLKKLDHIRAMNKNFMNNSTFRDIVVNGTINETGMRMLVEAYPELGTYLSFRSGRRQNDLHEPKDYLDYDVEYGLLYF